MSRHLVLRALAVCVAAFVTLFGFSLFAPATAFAQGGKKSIAVGVIEGPQGESTRKRVLQTLKKSNNYEITDAEDLRPGSDKSAYAAMAQALQVDAIVVGKVSRNLELTLSVIGPDGNLIEDVKLKGGSAPALESAIDNDLEIAIAGPLGGKKAAKAADKPKVEEEPEDEEEAVPEDEQDAKAGKDDDEDEGDKDTKEDEEPTEEKQPGRRPLELVVGARLYSRSFVYQDPTTVGRFIPYKLAIAPAIVASARIYPFAFFRDDALSHVGIMGKLEVGIATSTKYEEQQPPPAPPITYPLNTGTSEWQIGLRGRVPVGESELGMFGLYGAHAFVLVGDEGPSGTPGTPDYRARPPPLVPDVNYQFVRFGIDARLRTSKLTVGSHFAPRFLTSLSNVNQSFWWFPGATGSGIDFGAFVGYEILKFLDLAVGVDYVRYGFDFNAIPDDAGTPGSPAQKIAGGATDTFISGWLGVILHFDGKAKVEDGVVAVEAEPESEGEPEPEKKKKKSEVVEEEEEE